jgi:WD40 repeat protein
MRTSPHSHQPGMMSAQLTPPHPSIHHISSWTRRDFIAGVRRVGVATVLLPVSNWLVACSPGSKELKPNNSIQLLPEIGNLWSPDLKLAATNAQNAGLVSIIDIAKQQKLVTLEGPNVYANFSPLRRPWSANSQYLLLVSAQSDNKPDLYLNAYNTYTGKKLYTGIIDNAKSMSYAWSPDGTRIALAGKDTVTLWHGATGKLLSETTLGISSLNIEVLSWSPDSKLLALATVEGSGVANRKLSVRIWDSQTRAIATIYNIPTTTNSISSFGTLSWSPRGSMIAALLTDGTNWIIHPFKRNEIFALDRKFTAPAWVMDWSLDDRYLAIPNAGTAEIWDITRRELAYNFSFSLPDSIIAWSHTNKNTIVSIEGNTMKTWSLS